MEKLEVTDDSIWQHTNGGLYRVLMTVNLPDEERYPKMVVYENTTNGTQWARRHDDWHRSFTYVNN